MRILFINSIRDWGGGEVWLFDIAAGLLQAGHRVIIGCRNSSQIHLRAQQRGLPTHTLCLRGGMNPLAIMQVLLLAHRERIDLICSNMDHDLRIAVPAKFFLKRPVLVPSREVDMPMNNRTDMWFFSRFADGVMANSDATASSFLRSIPGFPKEKVKVVYKGIDVAAFAGGTEKGALLREKWGIGPDEPVLGYVGKFSQRKGVPVLLRAAQRILTENPKVRIVFAGEGPLDTEIREWVKTSSFGDRCLLPGFLEDKHALMNALDVLVLPSLFEGFGYVLVEAMACGKPVVSTNVSSAPEVVAQDETGLLVTPNDASGLAEALLRLLGAPALRQSMGLAGARRAQQLFNRERMIRETESFFGTVFRKKHISPA